MRTCSNRLTHLITLVYAFVIVLVLIVLPVYVCLRVRVRVCVCMHSGSSFSSSWCSHCVDVYVYGPHAPQHFRLQNARPGLVRFNIILLVQ